jgi:hypothetical protein
VTFSAAEPLAHPAEQTIGCRPPLSAMDRAFRGEGTGADDQIKMKS